MSGGKLMPFQGNLTTASMELNPLSASFIQMQKLKNQQRALFEGK